MNLINSPTPLLGICSETKALFSHTQFQAPWLVEHIELHLDVDNSRKIYISERHKSKIVVGDTLTESH